MAGGPDLFVVCKNCGSEVSPYVTECPYCGTRLRRRAPKLERDDEGVRARKPRVRKPRLAPLRRDEIPGIRADSTRPPYATITLVLLSLFGFLSLAFVTRGEVALLTLENEAWRLATSAFVYGNTWYQLAVVTAIGIFGWRLELRHGPLLVLALFLAGGVGGNALAVALDDTAFVLGAPGAAMALLAVWAAPDVLRARRAEDHDADLLGTLVFAVVIGLMPLAYEPANDVATLVGLVLGIVLGWALSRTAAAQ